jgi:hypothetical protein
MQISVVPAWTKGTRVVVARVVDGRVGGVRKDGRMACGRMACGRMKDDLQKDVCQIAGKVFHLLVDRYSGSSSPIHSSLSTNRFRHFPAFHISKLLVVE